MKINQLQGEKMNHNTQKFGAIATVDIITNKLYLVFQIASSNSENTFNIVTRHEKMGLICT